MRSVTDSGRGAANLLDHCAGVAPGQRLLLIEEPPGQRFYCPRIGDALAARAAALGVSTTRIDVPIDAAPEALPAAVRAALADADHAVFLSRLGDYSRFLPLPGACTKTVCYVLDEAALASPFAATSYPLMQTLLTRLEDELERAERWRITCPLGTDIGGAFCWPSRDGGADDEFSLGLFPVTTFKPVPCDGARGRVALSRWLIPGAAARVEPATVSFDGVVVATVRDGRVLSFDGPAAAAVERHHQRVGDALGVRHDRVHSWHAGVNPHTAFAGPVDDELERWGAVSFASPRYLHFHTCGDAPPGEIAWSIFNPTVWIDDRPYWQRGQLAWLRRADNRALIRRHDPEERLLGASADIGVGLG